MIHGGDEEDKVKKLISSMLVKVGYLKKDLCKLIKTLEEEKRKL